MIFRLSQKLATKLKAGKLKLLPADENPYADWSCHLFTADRSRVASAFAGACLGVSANLKRFLAALENGRKGKRYIKQIAERWASICRAA